MTRYRVTVRNLSTRHRIVRVVSADTAMLALVKIYAEEYGVVPEVIDFRPGVKRADAEVVSIELDGARLVCQIEPLE